MSVGRRPRWVIVLLLGGSALVLATWWVASVFESPAQREARASAPSPVPVTAAVERGDLVRAATLQADIRREARASTAVPAPLDGSGVVTAHPAAVGETISSGRNVLEINGRGRLVLRGDFPFYRELRSGDSGRDVDQLQRGLIDAELLSAHDGAFGAATERAVRILFERADVPLDVERRPDGDDAVVLPLGQIIVMSTLPATLVAVPPIGSGITDDSSIATSSGQPVAVGEVGEAAAAALVPGTTGRITVDGSRRDVVVERTEQGRETDDGSAPASVNVVGAGTPLPSEWVGAETTIELEIEVAAKDALIVPSVAITPGGDGPAHVDVRTRSGSFRRIAVEELGELDGRSAVRPARESDLRVGEEVRVR